MSSLKTKLAHVPSPFCIACHRGGGGEISNYDIGNSEQKSKQFTKRDYFSALNRFAFTRRLNRRFFFWERVFLFWTVCWNVQDKSIPFTLFDFLLYFAWMSQHQYPYQLLIIYLQYLSALTRLRWVLLSPYLGYNLQISAYVEIKVLPNHN